MSATIRAVTVVSLMGGVVVVVLVAWIVAGHVLESGRVGSIDDWFHWLAPLVPPLVVIVGIAATNRMRARGHFAPGLLTGIVVASGLYLVVPMFYLATQFDVIARDGTAFWGLAFMPVVLIWLPLTAVGMLTGAGVVAVLRVRKAK
jgi:hypothetical protein